MTPKTTGSSDGHPVNFLKGRDNGLHAANHNRRRNNLDRRREYRAEQDRHYD
jgi:hypothetical protein